MITYVLGPSCAGKSTWVASRAREGDVIVDFDALCRAFGSRAWHEHSESILRVAFRARAAAEKRIREGLEGDQYIIRTVMSPPEINEASAAGARFVILDPGEQVAVDRAVSDKRPEGTIDRIRDWYEDPPQVPPEYLMPDDAKGGVVRTKSLVADIQQNAEDTGEEAGVFTGYASVFGNLDSYGDRVVQGAFEKTLTTFGPDGSGIPCYWSHQMDDPMKCIGWTLEAKEDDRGLWVKVKLDLDNPMAQQVHRLMKAGLVKHMSFAFDVEDFAFVTEGSGDQICELRELKIFEVSVVQVGANQETELLDVKDRLVSVKAGRKISADNEQRLTKAAELIGEVLASIDDEDRGEKPVESEEPPAKNMPAKALSAADIAEIELELLKGASDAYTT